MSGILKKPMSPSGFFEKKIILCSKPDDITGFDGSNITKML
jgi:hypothetical protein